MPELPEVETVRRGLERTVVGKTVATVEVRVLKLFPQPQALIDKQLVGGTIAAAQRRAKVLLLRLDNGWTLAIHLKMTGQIVVRAKAAGFVAGHPEKVYEQPLPHKHTHVIITFSDGTVLYFNDLRKFGWMRLVASTDELFEATKLGPEPFGEDFTPVYFAAALKNRRIPIKTALLDQKVVAGVGNIYADEALFEARISPFRNASSLKKDEITKLFEAVKHVLKLGIEYGGTTFNSYINAEGSAGRMRDYLKVYGREGQSCRDCTGLVLRKKIGQRSTHYCPDCQR